MDKSKLLLARISDKINQYKKSGEQTYSFFLDPEEQVEAESVLRNIPHCFWGGYVDAERKILIIGMDEIDTDFELPIRSDSYYCE